MPTTIQATFDGHMFRPVGPISLPANTSVRLTVEPLPDQSISFLRTAQSLNLEGPPTGRATCIAIPTAGRLRKQDEVFLDAF